MQFLCSSLIGLLALSSFAASVAVDTETSKALEEAIANDEFVLSIKHIKPRKRLRGSIETLFAVDFPGSQQKLVIQLDRRAKKVVVETVEDGQTRSQHFTVETLSDNAIIRSLILAVNQEKPAPHITLYVDCMLHGKVSTPRTMRDMFKSMRNARLNVYRERRYVVEIDTDTDIHSVLNRNNCPDMSMMMQDIQAQDRQDRNEIRGDIPSVHDCDDNLLVKTINDLIGIIKKLRDEVERQRVETHNLRQLLEQCDICSQGERR